MPLAGAIRLGKHDQAPHAPKTLPGTCEKMYFEERGVGTMVGEYVTFVGW